ncbi:MAG TPA: hypothetical protein VG407_05875 [Caulobacteraceae bacterium]|jgi:hypothetical protein|nr:hypothetical protein [Caulobacteraceae bacterium]
MSAQRQAPASHPVLTVVQTANDSVQVQTLAERIERLQAEAKNLAREQVTALETKLSEAAALAEEISHGGDVYPVGVRELARKLAEDAPRTAMNLEAIIARA